MNCKYQKSDYGTGTIATGSIEAYEISLNLENGQTMDDVTFTAAFYFNRSFVTSVAKAAMTRIDSLHYVAYVDTTAIGAGAEMKCEITVSNFMDTDYTAGTRLIRKVFTLTDERVVKSVAE